MFILPLINRSIESDLEEGTLRLYIMGPSSSIPHLPSSQPTLDEYNRSVSGLTLRSGSHVKLLPVKGIFVSSHWPGENMPGFARTQQLQRVAGEIFAKYGYRFVPDPSERPVSGSITNRTVDYLKSVVGFIQFLTIRSKGEALSRPDLGWLDGEYLAAKALGLEPIRIVDVSFVNEDKWAEWSKFDRDNEWWPYDFGDPNFETWLRDQLSNWVNKLP